MAVAGIGDRHSGSRYQQYIPNSLAAEYPFHSDRKVATAS
jgi:hypothetical protein